MPIPLTVPGVEGNINLYISEHPDICPLCNRHQEPIMIGAFRQDSTHLQISYRCTNVKCLGLFIGYFARSFNDSYSHLIQLRPQNLPSPVCEVELENLSPDFCDIYRQAVHAEAKGLIQVSGCGYRKSLEFLIKDYCITNNPGKTEEIKKATLGAVIATYIDNHDIKACASRAAWLGNDETHYVRKWEDMDIQDLKQLLDLTSYWMVSRIKTKNYLSKMPGKAGGA